MKKLNQTLLAIFVVLAGLTILAFLTQITAFLIINTATSDSSSPEIHLNDNVTNWSLFLGSLFSAVMGLNCEAVYKKLNEVLHSNEDEQSEN